jgi:hypothetical protein
MNYDDERTDMVYGLFKKLCVVLAIILISFSISLVWMMYKK